MPWSLVLYKNMSAFQGLIILMTIHQALIKPVKGLLESATFKLHYLNMLRLSSTASLRTCRHISNHISVNISYGYLEERYIID